MKKIKNILIASELNKESYEALAYGITLGLMYEAKVSCIHVIKPSPIDIIKETFKIGTAKYGDAIKAAKTESENMLSHIVDVIAQELGVGEVDVNLKIVSGTMSTSIVNYALEVGADIDIIGTEAGSRFSKTQHTNLALNMIKTEAANVLLIPKGFAMERIDQMGAFINFEVEELSFIHNLVRLSARTEKPLKLIHVLEQGETVQSAKLKKESFEKLLSQDINSKKVKIEMVLDKVEDVVDNLKSKYNIDLMSIRAYKRHWGLYTESTDFADKVIKKIACPLLIWKTSAKKKQIVVKERLQIADVNSPSYRPTTMLSSYY